MQFRPYALFIGGVLVGTGFATFILPALLLAPVALRELTSEQFPEVISLSWLNRNGIHLDDQSAALIIELFILGLALMCAGAVLVAISRKAQSNSG